MIRFGLSCLSSAAAVLTLATLPGVATAQPWSSVGAGCVPAGQTSSANFAINGAGGATFASGKVGNITLTCPITFPFRASDFFVSLRDPDGADTGAHVKAAMWRRNQLTGLSSVVNAARIDSNVDDSTALRSERVRIGVDGCGDYSSLGGYFYYVKISMRRTTTAQPVVFGGAWIDTTVC